MQNILHWYFNKGSGYVFNFCRNSAYWLFSTNAPVVTDMTSGYSILSSVFCSTWKQLIYWTTGMNKQVTKAVNPPARLFVSPQATTGLTVMDAVLLWTVYLSAGCACWTQIFKPPNQRTAFREHSGLEEWKQREWTPPMDAGWPGLRFLNIAVSKKRWRLSSSTFMDNYTQELTYPSGWK